MAELVLTDINEITLLRLQGRASRHGRSPVTDASVGVKWFVPEVLSDEAWRWRSGPDELHTLAFFSNLEIASVLW